MPSNVVKSYAKKTGKKVGEVEGLWKKAEELVKDEYENVEVGSDRFYKLVNGTVKRMLKLDEEYQNLKYFNQKYEDTISKFQRETEDEIQ